MELAGLPPCKLEHAGCVKITKHPRVVHDYPRLRAHCNRFRANFPSRLIHGLRGMQNAYRPGGTLHLFGSAAISYCRRQRPLSRTSLSNRASADFHNVADENRIASSGRPAPKSAPANSGLMNCLLRSVDADRPEEHDRDGQLRVSLMAVLPMETRSDAAAISICRKPRILIAPLLGHADSGTKVG
jgi:hypothetical protein